MKTLLLSSFCLLLVLACNNNTVKKPVWKNPQTILSIPIDSLVFQADSKNWNAVLLSFAQPIPMTLSVTETGFVVKQNSRAGVTEGPAQLVLTSKGQNFYYSVSLQNNAFSSFEEKDYRSPKTMNADSSLQQQRLMHTIDHWRNLMYTGNPFSYFSEDSILLSPGAGVFRAQEGKALSAFYVQPGSPVKIPVSATYLAEKNLFRVTAGPLQDAYNNMIADGTLVAFLYSDDITHYRMEAATQNGIATVWVAGTNGKPVVLKAIVHQISSQPLQLKPQ